MPLWRSSRVRIVTAFTGDDADGLAGNDGDEPVEDLAGNEDSGLVRDGRLMESSEYRLKNGENFNIKAMIK